MDSCIFCKIINGKLPSYKLYEDELFIGFLDIFPRSKGHTLMIPKKHHRWVYDVPEFDQYWLAALKVTKALQQSVNPSYISYLTLGMEVPHAHIHIIPRFEKSEKLPDTQKASSEDLQTLAEQIKRAL